MTYLEVLTEIGAQLNDPDLETYKERIKPYFLTALISAIKSGEFTDADYAGWVKLEDDLDFDSNPADIESLNALEIKGLYPNPAVSEKMNIVEKTVSEISRIGRNTELSPGYEDLFWYRVGNSLYAVVGSPTIFDLTNDDYHLQYIEDIDDSTWADGTDFDTTTYSLSDRILKTAITTAVALMKPQIAGE